MNKGKEEKKERERERGRRLFDQSNESSCQSKKKEEEESIYVMDGRYSGGKISCMRKLDSSLGNSD